MEDTHRDDRSAHDTRGEQPAAPRVRVATEAVVRLLANPRRVRRT